MAVLSPSQVDPRLHERRLHATPVQLWHLLSLDAPTVAALWTWFIAATAGVALPVLSILSMALAVWMLYAADRLLDARHLVANPLHTGDLEQRHRFHHRHRSAFLLGISFVSLTLAVLIPRLGPETLHLDLVLGALLAGYFILIHAAGSSHRLPKELAVGPFFAAAVFIPTVARAPALRTGLLPAALLFALLCSLNCLFIYHWEHLDLESRQAVPPSQPHPATRLALHHLTPVARLAVVASIALVLLTSHQAPTANLWLLPAACVLSILLLLLLHTQKRRMHPLTLRAAADLALLTPLLFLPLLTHIAL